ncbi:hypothetical protein JCM3765_001440 [Sporobolomyces pararoseus]
MPKHVQAPHGKKNKKGGKPKQTTKDKVKGKARTIVEKGKQFLPSSSSQHLENVNKSSKSSPTTSYPQTFYNDDLSVKPLYSDPASRVKAPSEIASGGSTRSNNSSFNGRVMVEEGGYYDVEDHDEEYDDGYHADYRSDLGDEFYAGNDEDEEEGEEDDEVTTTNQLPVNRYDGLVYVTDGSPSPTSSFSSASSSSGEMEEEDERRRRQTTMGNSETSWEDASPATSTSQQLYSPPPKSTKLQSAQLPEYRYAPVSASFSYLGPSYDPNLPPAADHPSSIHYSTQPHHHHHHDTYSSHLVETYTQSAAPSPAISPSNSGASTPRGRNPHPRLLWRSQLSAQIIDALDQHHRKIAGEPLPRIIEPKPLEPDHSTLDVVPEREGTGKLDEEVRERDKERERIRMGKNRKPLSREGRRWSRAVEKWGL